MDKDERRTELQVRFEENGVIAVGTDGVWVKTQYNPGSKEPRTLMSPVNLLFSSLAL
jgi:hypothetical protein